ncbi:ABC transporter permease [Paenibacillus sp. HB172176]|uniref:ABC transporter permease n=1 Tax=Paenibacillus sp. HB172176 TaxID=2493690 RepID=UPI001438996C|nr:ABC transporter permease [Paenibacillus sp. HB172176]
MRAFYKLMNDEFRRMSRGALAVSLAAALMPLIFISIETGRGAARYERFENLYASSGSVMLSCVFMIAMIGVFLLHHYAAYWNNKGVYTLLTLPVRRESLYFSRLAAFMLCFLLLWAGEGLSMWLGYELAASKAASLSDGVGVMHEGWFLAVVRSPFFQIIIPLTWKGLMSSLSLFIFITTGIYYGVLCERSRKYWGLAVLAVAAFYMMRVVKERLTIPGWYDSGFDWYRSSFILLAISAYFIWYGVRLMKRGSIA